MGDKNISGNCDVWGTVDFGEGPVRIRCTMTDVTANHKDHVCVVVIKEDK